MMKRLAITLFACAFFLSGTSILAGDTSILPGRQQDERVYRPGNGVTLPRAVTEVKPSYTPGAMQERVQGTVWLECVVGSNGKPRDIEVTKALHDELDESAIAALRQWVFEPATRNDAPVAVRITVELTFTLK